MAILAVLFIFSFYLIFYKNFNVKKNLVSINKNNNSEYDILNPQFSINNNKEKISVKANEGNFINNDKILLHNNVVFKSHKFIIHSSEVYFDKKSQTASSINKTTFESDGALINSAGFSIENSGNDIKFTGKTKLKLLK